MWKRVKFSCLGCLLLELLLVAGNWMSMHAPAPRACSVVQTDRRLPTLVRSALSSNWYHSEYPSKREWRDGNARTRCHRAIFGYQRHNIARPQTEPPPADVTTATSPLTPGARPTRALAAARPPSSAPLS